MTAQQISDTPCEGCVYNWRDKKCMMTPISNQSNKCAVCSCMMTCLYLNPVTPLTATGTQPQWEHCEHEWEWGISDHQLQIWKQIGSDVPITELHRRKQSRPHTPAPERKCTGLAEHWTAKEARENHDAAIASAATLATLDKIEAWCKLEWKSVEYLDEQPKDIIRDEIIAFRKYFKSLRQSTTAQEQHP